MIISKTYWLVILAGLTVATATSCQKLRISRPLCGPESFDRRPYARLPDHATGCYEMQSSDFTSVSGDNTMVGRASVQYIYVSPDRISGGIGFSDSGPILRKTIANAGVKIEDDQLIPICEVPMKDADPNSFIVMTKAQGLTELAEYTFNPDPGSIIVRYYDIALEDIRSSGLSYSVFPSATSMESRKPQYPTREIFDGLSTRIPVINNNNITPEELFERISFRRSQALIELSRVDMKFCQGMKIHKFRFK